MVFIHAWSFQARCAGGGGALCPAALAAYRPGRGVQASMRTGQLQGALRRCLRHARRPDQLQSGTHSNPATIPTALPCPATPLGAAAAHASPAPAERRLSGERGGGRRGAAPCAAPHTAMHRVLAAGCEACAACVGGLGRDNPLAETLLASAVRSAVQPACPAQPACFPRQPRYIPEEITWSPPGPMSPSGAEGSPCAPRL